MKLSGLSDTTISLWLLTYDCLSGDVNKLAFANLSFRDCFMQLICERVEDDNFVPRCLTTLVVHSEWKTGNRLIICCTEPRVTTEMSLQLALLDFAALLSLRSVGRSVVSSCDVIRR